MIGLLYSFSKYLVPIIYLYKSHIQLKIEYSCHIWTTAAQTSLSSLGSVQKRLRVLVGEEIFSPIPTLLSQAVCGERPTIL